MADISGHVELNELDAYISGRLEPGAAAAIKRHLDECPLCRVEVMQIGRFEDIGSDDELAGEADWPAARFKMERAFKDRVLPNIAAEPAAESEAKPPFLMSRWLAPLTAAAAVILIFVYIERLHTPQHDFGPMRGVPGAEYEVILDSPVGNIADYPEKFDWHSEVASDYYKIEIFTSDLEQVYVIENLEESDWTMPDSIRTRFERGTFYLWNVKGYRGLKREIASPNAWFRIMPAD